jgi:hypothetical protein
MGSLIEELRRREAAARALPPHPRAPRGSAPAPSRGSPHPELDRHPAPEGLYPVRPVDAGAASVALAVVLIAADGLVPVVGFLALAGLHPAAVGALVALEAGGAGGAGGARAALRHECAEGAGLGGCRGLLWLVGPAVVVRLGHGCGAAVPVCAPSGCVVLPLVPSCSGPAPRVVKRATPKYSTRGTVDHTAPKAPGQESLQQSCTLPD